MRYLILLLSLAMLTRFCRAQTPPPKHIDNFEMRTYYLLHLLTGPRRDQDTATTNALQRSHLAHLTQLYQEGKLVMAGPILQTEGDLRGIGVMVAPSADSARVWAERDPSVRAGRLRVQILPWMSARGMCLP